MLVVQQGLTGGTTVSGTMIGAHCAAIPIFVTGGIGGVHRGGQTSEFTLLLRVLRVCFDNSFMPDFDEN